MSLDPQIQTIVDQIALIDPPPASDVTPEEFRAGYAVLGALSPRSDAVSVDDHWIETPNGPLALRTYRPIDAPADVRPGLIYFHGGGHTIGSVDTHDGPASLLAELAGVVVAAVEYRLAPEHPFPADVDDADATVRWVAEHATEIGVDPDRLGVGGDSAGGNLAVVAALHARARSGPTIAALVLIYPWLDLACDRPSMQENGSGFVMTRADLETLRGYYAPEASWTHPDASAIYADLAGLPPTVIATCGFDPLRDQGDEFAQRLTAAGVNVTHLQYPDLIHTFVQLTAVSERAKAATEEIAREAAALLFA
ncbi:MAG TPA: alpha/beta hydrolase [Acidimicrobiia bacterium]|nr:alpha/beta hydrolase [Acidimicrobiia bacterium]